MKIELEIEDVRREEIIDAAAQILLSAPTTSSRDLDGDQADRLMTMLEQRLDDAVMRAVNDGIDTSVRVLIASEVERVLGTGWPIVDEYGRDTGKVRTLKSIVADALATKHGYNSAPLAVSVATETITRMLQQGFAQEIADAQKRFRTQVDDLLNAKIADALRTALGLR